MVKKQKEAVVMEFHISREARDRYRFDESLFSLRGNVILANFHATRVFAQRMNQKRDEILHVVVGLYREQMNPEAIRQALEWLQEELGAEAVDAALRRFAADFPPVAVYRREIRPETYLGGETAGVPHRHVVLEELIMLWLTNVNPAFSPFRELFDDTALERETAYTQIASSLNEFFETQPLFGPDNQDLVDMLRSPAIAVPHSLSGQLEYMREHWGSLLGRYLYRLLSSLDLIREEERAIFLGPGPAQVVEFTGMEAEPERFSPDSDWMPRVVLLAKNGYVWLDQLSRRYQRPITRLDQIPDEELDTLARWGFSGLWLIGLWERSPASKRISAYSLYDYQIAADLGGEAAYQNLKDRAWQRGIRLASDMVPNHVGIYSRWVVEHPDWFVALDYSPFPSYGFNGPDLSDDERVGIFVEDHYYDRSDAAVVFKRRDRWTGSEKFIYHGNDGTSMPWNDTAQLNYLNPEVREAVIQTILHVARQFPIIRFDAAMTLTKKHFQRLWFPEPGSGGAIPTRAEHGLTKAEFNAAMPAEFWREVVDRVAAEAPDTLLLAEAFWMLEGYFVRTLGMHRVYNSAFMNMLRDEDNAKYRSVMKNTLEFDPEVLKRYVNFRSKGSPRSTAWSIGGRTGTSRPMATWSNGTSGRSSPCCTAATCLPRWSISACTMSSPPKVMSMKMCTPIRIVVATSERWWSTTTSSPPRRAGSEAQLPIRSRPGQAAMVRLRSPQAGCWCRRPWAKVWGCFAKTTSSASSATTSPAWSTSGAARDCANRDCMWNWTPTGIMSFSTSARCRTTSGTNTHT
jgi:hypothetical protein